MTLYVTEYGNVQRAIQAGLVVNPTPLRTYAMSSTGSAGTTSGAVLATAQFVRVSADTGMLFAISSSTGLTLSSTNAVRIPPNVAPELFAVPVGSAFSLMAAST